MVTLRLTAAGMAALLAETTARGGFETYLRRLQSRADPATGEVRLTLADWLDLPRMAGYAGGSGGFEGRAKAILAGVRAVVHDAERVARERECSSCWRVMSEAEWHGQLICDDCLAGRSGPVFDARDGVRVATFVRED